MIVKKTRDWRHEAFSQGAAELDAIVEKHPDSEYCVSAALIAFGMLIALPSNATEKQRDDYMKRMLQPKTKVEVQK